MEEGIEIILGKRSSAKTTFQKRITESSADAAASLITSGQITRACFLHADCDDDLVRYLLAVSCAVYASQI